MTHRLPLITTKLHRPPVSGDHVARPRLTRRLHHGLARPLTLVCAGAGFGKTTLVSAWLAEEAEHNRLIDAGDGHNGDGPHPFLHAWLSLDSRDSDLGSFVTYLVAALRTLAADACPDALELVRARTDPPLTLLTATLINEIAQLPAPFVLVLDDLSAIHGEAVFDLLNGLIQHWPPAMHLVLITRHNPPLPLARLRAAGQITEIRSRDLRFTAEETAVYLGKSLPVAPDPATLAALEQQTEGWIVGLQLAALALRASGDAATEEAPLAAAEAHAADYLVDEVLAGQPPAVQTFLLKTALFDRFDAALGAAIGAADDPQWPAQDCLAWIQRADLFIVPLDNQRRWHRYHHLFQGMLRRRLHERCGPEEINRLHRVASAWFADQGLMDEALQQALAGGAPEQAAGMMEGELCAALNRDDRPTLERWLCLLPEELIQRRPRLLMIRAWVQSWAWQIDEVARTLRQVEALLASPVAATTADEAVGDQSLLRGQILGLRGQEAFLHNQHAQAVVWCREALDLIPARWKFARGGFMLYLALGMHALGQGEEGERLLLAEYENCHDKTDPFALRLLQALSFNYLQEGRLEAVRQSAQELLHQATRADLPVVLGWAHYFLGRVAYQWDELALAAQHFVELADKRYVIHSHAARNGMIGLAQTYASQGEFGLAWQSWQQLSQFDLDLTGHESDQTRSLRARLLLLQGDLMGAGRWADAFSAPLPDRPLIWLQQPHVTKARILLVRGGPTDVPQALEIADALLTLAWRTHCTRSAITAQALRALALLKQERTRAANEALQQAVELARPGGLIRVFVDLGPQMRSMLSRLAEQGIAAQAIQPILAAFAQQDAAGAAERGAQPALHGALRVPGLLEPLTLREWEILTLLRQPHSGKEIAGKLCISPATLKRHTSNIYGKLGVHNRWDAVAAAEDLGVLARR